MPKHPLKDIGIHPTYYWERWRKQKDKIKGVSANVIITEDEYWGWSRTI